MNDIDLEQVNSINSCKLLNAKLNSIQIKLSLIASEIQNHLEIKNEDLALEIIEEFVNIKKFGTSGSASSALSSTNYTADLQIHKAKHTKQALYEKINRLERKYAEDIQKAEKALFKAITRSEEIIIDLNFFRSTNMNLVHVNNEYIKQINNLQDELYDLKSNGNKVSLTENKLIERKIHAKEKAKYERSSEIKELLFEFNKDIAECSALILTRLEDWSILRKNHLQVQIPCYKPTLIVFTYKLDIITMKSEKTIHSIIIYLEKNGILQADNNLSYIERLEFMSNQLKDLKESFELLNPISTSDNFFDKLLEFISISERNHSLETTKLRESLKEMNIQLTIEKYKFNQANEQRTILQSSQQLVQDIKVILGSQFTGDLLENIRQLLENKHFNTRNSISSEELIYTPEEEFEIILNTTSLKAELDKMEISYISECEDNRIIEFKEEIKELEKKVKDKKGEIFRNKEQIRVLKNEIREAEMKKQKEMSMLEDKIQMMEEQLRSSQRFEKVFVKELFSNLVKRIPESININGFTFSVFKLLEFTDDDIQLISKERAILKNKRY